LLNSLKEKDLSKKVLDKAASMAAEISGRLGRPPVFMEVCGTHTNTIAKSGIKSLFAGILNLKSGPGCPVCVTDQADIDTVIELARRPNTVIYAAGNPGKEVVFLGVGFETTAPVVALTIRSAKKRGVKNFSVLSFHKIVPPALSVLLQDSELILDGMILPGHVCTITGRKAFDFISAVHNLPAVIAGFETLDILKAVYLLLDQLISGRPPETVNSYTRLVREEENKPAKEVMEDVFSIADATWRGFGVLPGSGLSISNRYAGYDAARRFGVRAPALSRPSGCACGDVLRGKISTPECPLFARVCTPLRPAGPCMVSSEGACAAYYRYEWSDKKS